MCEGCTDTLYLQLRVNIVMRHQGILSIAILGVLLASPTIPATASLGSSVVIQYWYTWGTNIVGGAQVWTYGGTNVTMNATFSEQGGVQTEEITEFHVFAR